MGFIGFKGLIGLIGFIGFKRLIGVVGFIGFRGLRVSGPGFGFFSGV